MRLRCAQIRCWLITRIADLIEYAVFALDPVGPADALWARARSNSAAAPTPITGMPHKQQDHRPELCCGELAMGYCPASIDGYCLRADEEINLADAPCYG